MKSLIKFVFKKIGLYQPTVRLLIFLETYPLSQLIDNIKMTLAGSKIIMPPAKLRHLVSGNYSIRWFTNTGENSLTSLTNILEKQNLNLADMNSVLDFGCGCGRVIQQVHTVNKNNLLGCDYNPLLINWCHDKLTYAKFYTNNLTPPLTYENDSFELVYMFSVFTHLTVEQHDEWLTELHRVIKPNAYLILSTHGPDYRERIPKELQADFDAGKMVVQKSSQAGENHCGAYHPASFYENNHLFSQLQYIRKGAFGNPDQDLYLLQKK